jgi:hypothetical protein
MSYDSTVDELQLSYQGGSDPSIGNLLWVMTQLWMNYNWVTKVEVIHPLETCYEFWLDYGWTTTELPRWKWSIHWKPIMSYDSTVDELQLSYQSSTSHLGNLSPKPSYFGLSPHTTRVTSNNPCKWINIICK